MGELQILSLQLLHGMVGGACGQRHVENRRALIACARHAAQLLGRPSAADPRADHNGIVGVFLNTASIDIHRSNFFFHDSAFLPTILSKWRFAGNDARELPPVENHGKESTVKSKLTGKI